MKFNLGNAAPAAVPQSASDDQFIAALQDLMLAKDHLYVCESQYQEALEVETNCKSAIASLESFGLTDQFLAVFNRDGDLFRQLGMDDVAGSCESMEPEQKEEKKDSMMSKFGKAAVGAGKAVAAAAEAVWQAIIEFLKRWFTVNGRMAAHLEKNLSGLTNASEERFKEIKRTGLGKGEMEIILKGIPAVDKLMSAIKDGLPDFVGMAIDLAKKNQAPSSLDEEAYEETAIMKAFKDAPVQELASVGLSYADGSFKEAWPFENKEGTYGSAGWTVAFLNANVKKVIDLLKADAAATKAVEAAITKGYNSAKSAGIMDKPAVKRVMNHVRMIVKHKAKLISTLGSQFDAAVGAATKNSGAPIEAAPVATK